MPGSSPITPNTSIAVPPCNNAIASSPFQLAIELSWISHSAKISALEPVLQITNVAPAAIVCPVKSIEPVEVAEPFPYNSRVYPVKSISTPVGL